jgi:predicted DNA-binding transcriptional regulator YafY
MADEYEVSTKSITRSINDLKNFLADHRELVGNTELRYSHQDKCYRLYMDEFLSSKELFALTEVMIGARAFSQEELLNLIDKLRRFTTPDDRVKLGDMIRKELYHYSQVRHDCESVQERLWQLVNCINEKREISVDYYRMDRKWVTHRLRPASVMFSDYYFYLVAFKIDKKTEIPTYFRVDRIKKLTIHRKRFTAEDVPTFDEGWLRDRSLFMWPGPLRTIRFEFNGSSVQAVLDKLPTAKIIDRFTTPNGGTKYLIEAETYGDGIKMWLLSQGSWVKVISPADFVEMIKKETLKMAGYYKEE